MEKLEVELVSSKFNCIAIYLQFTNIKVQNDALLIVNVYKRNSSKHKVTIKQKEIGENEYSKQFSLKFYAPLSNKLIIDSLSQGTMYKLNFFLENGKSTYNAVLYASTVYDDNLDNQLAQLSNLTENQDLSKLESVLKEDKKKNGISQSENFLINGVIDNIYDQIHFKSKQEVEQLVMKGRFSKNTKQFINQNYKFAKPKSTHSERLKRTLIVARGLETYDDIYGFKKETKDNQKGKEFMKNDWFMGPFYSYDYNSEDMRKKQTQQLKNDVEN